MSSHGLKKHYHNHNQNKYRGRCTTVQLVKTKGNEITLKATGGRGRGWKKIYQRRSNEIEHPTPQQTSRQPETDYTLKMLKENYHQTRILHAAKTSFKHEDKTKTFQANRNWNFFVTSISKGNNKGLLGRRKMSSAGNLKIHKEMKHKKRRMLTKLNEYQLFNNNDTFWVSHTYIIFKNECADTCCLANIHSVLFSQACAQPKNCICQFSVQLRVAMI